MGVPSSALPRPRIRQLLAAILAAGLAAGCGEDVQGPTAGGVTALSVTATVASPGETTARQQGSGGLASAFQKADSVEIRVTRRSDGSELAERAQSFQPSTGTTELQVEVRLGAEEVPARLSLELLAAGDRIFEGARDLTLEAGQTATVQLTLDPVADGLAVPQGPVMFAALGDSTQLSAAVLFATGDTIPGAGVTWSSSDASVALVRSDGTVVARAPGEATATATHDGLSGSVDVVVDPEASAVMVSPATAELTSLGAVQTFSASVTDANGNPVPDAQVSWSSTDGAVASVDASGRATALGAGTTGVVARVMGVADTAQLQVALGPTGQLTGQVTEVQPDGSAALSVPTAPLGGVSVEFLQDGQAVSRTTTASDGSWTSPRLPTGSYDVRYVRDGFESATLFGAVVEEGATGSVTTVPLVPASDQPGTASGQVVGASTGSGLEGVTVALHQGVNNPGGPVVASAETGADGSYSLSGVAAGTYTLTASASGFETASTVGVVVGGQEVGGQDLELQGNRPPTVTITSPEDGATVPPTLTLEGSAEDPDEGTLTGDALVWSSDVDGELGTGATLQVTLSTGSHTLTLTATDVQGATGSASVAVTVGEGGQLEGRVTDGNTDQGLGDVEVRFVAAGSTSVRAPAASAVGSDATAGVVATTTTGSDGRWTSPPLAPGPYDIEFARDGRANTTLFGAEVTAGVTTPVAPVPLAPEGGTGGIAGVVQNARTVEAISGATVELRSGVNHTGGSALASTTTASDGSFEFQGVQAGTYTVLARADGFVDGSRTTAVIGGETASGQEVNLSPEAQGELRVVLTWGETPSDLDAHLRGPLPDSDSRFHVYFANPGSLESAPFAALDRDDVTSFGPETITVSQVADGVYRYAVHDFTNRLASPSSPSTALANSGAQVEVFRGGEKVAEFFPPSQDGTEWIVFEFDGTRVTPVGTMEYESQPSNVGLTGAGVRAPGLVVPQEKGYDEDRGFGSH